LVTKAQLIAVSERNCTLRKWLAAGSEERNRTASFTLPASRRLLKAKLQAPPNSSLGPGRAASFCKLTEYSLLSFLPPLAAGGLDNSQGMRELKLPSLARRYCLMGG